jgi:threonine synthase
VATYCALHVLRESGGTAVACDDDLMRAMEARAGAEGVFLELSSAAALCATAAARADGIIGPGDVVVALGTASGLTDPAAFLAGSGPAAIGGCGSGSAS